MAYRYIITHKSKIPIVSGDNVLKVNYALPSILTPDLWYDGDTGDLRTNRGKTGSNLNGGTLTQSSIGSRIAWTGTGKLSTTDNVGSSNTTTFWVGTRYLNDFYYNYGTTGSSTNRGQVFVRLAGGTDVRVITSWSEDPVNAAYQPNKFYNYTDDGSASMIAFVSNHGAAWPGVNNKGRYNGVTMSSPGTPIGTSAYPTTATSYLQFTYVTNQKVGEILHYYRELSSSEISQVESYLSRKWQI